jgi:hypothetical protein
VPAREDDADVLYLIIPQHIHLKRQRVIRAVLAPPFDDPYYPSARELVGLTEHMGMSPIGISPIGIP